jgi:molybdate transport system substrate-binding protein
MVRVMKIVATAVALFLASTSLLAQPVAPPLRVLSSNGVRAVVEALVPDLEATLGRKLNIDFSTAAALKARIANGEPFDVAILTPTLIDALVAEEKIVAASRQNFARAGVGVGVRAGAPKPDVGTLDGLKRTLLAAKSVTFTADGQSRVAIDEAFERLGIVADMRAKTVLKGPGEPPHTVAAGEAEVVLTLVSEILPVPGVQLVGPLPPEVQSYVSFTAGRSTSARDVVGADALLRYLASPRALAELGAHGMEPYDR